MDRTQKEDDAGSGASSREGAGTLYVVGTPIGNLQDLSPRAREILGRADVIAAEDTRRTRILPSSIGVERPLIALHEHNEHEQAGRLLRLLGEGQSAALVESFGPERPAALARELTKVHEQVYAGTLGEVAEALGAEIPELGEIVIVVAGTEAPAAGEAEAARVFAVLSKSLPPSEAVAVTAELTGLPRNRVYRLTRLK
jgi:16S rRNA C1402 (ribose-2'-O) methylase RsmI